MSPSKTSKEKPKKERADGQVSGLSAEFFVAAELLKRDIQTSVTFGTAKAIDLLAYNPNTKKKFTVQVKALRRPTYFLIKPSKVDAEHIYIFVLLNIPGVAVEYFVVSGAELLRDSPRFDKYFDDSKKMPGISSSSKELKRYKDDWSVFLH